MEVGGSIYLTLLEISIMLFAAAVLRSALHRFKIPGIVADISIGVILSPYAVGGFLNRLLGVQLFQLNDYVVFLADFAVILIIFAAGLEHGMASLRSAGIWGALGAAAGALLP
ncbi:MAG: cation:proton antiporter, partial [Thermoproteus sp.]|nr:cation:proton antiporter [Thermoproteus sp.]